MEILEAFDLVGTLRGAAELVGCDHKTVGHYVDRAGSRRRRLAARAAALPAHRRLRGQDHRARRALGRQDAGRQGARAARGDGIRGLAAHDTTGGRPREGDL